MGITSVAIPTPGEENHKGTATVSPKRKSKLKQKGKNKEIKELKSGTHSVYHSQWHNTNDRVVYVYWHQRPSFQKRTSPEGL